MHIQSLTIEASLASLHATADGLSAGEAARRLGGFGQNRVEAVGRERRHLEATTACLATIVVMQAMNVLLCRHPQRSLFSAGLLGNPLIWLGIAAELALLGFIVYSATGNLIFGTAPVGAEVWLAAVGLALLMGAAEEARKAWVRQRVAAGREIT